MQLYFATGNQHKAQEVEAILRARGADVEILMHKGEEPVESGSTFLENALIKARAAFAATGAPSFADDSGIAVEVMGGAPGIFSAIWSGGRDDKTNRDLLLAQLIDVPEENRAAAFVCTMALVDDAGEVSVTGVWPGKIATQASGEHGFGYDPIFIPEGFSVTAAELEPEVKNSFSHRAMALQQLASLLTSR
jgi:XTP/dITP diphosphohydrolase